MSRARPNDRRSGGRRGGALLAVLWFSLALTAIVFALSRSVRAEFDRAALHGESLRAYYLAQGGIERALLRLVRPARPRSLPGGWKPGQSRLSFEFPAGRVEVEIRGESGKLDVNNAPPEALARLFAACGADPARAPELAVRLSFVRERLRGREAIWGESAAAAENSGGPSSFSAGRTSFLELEELLTVPGITPELFYGSYASASADGDDLRRREGLAHNLTVKGGAHVNVNYASRELLIAAGLPAGLVDDLIRLRRMRPLTATDPGLAGIERQQGGLIPLGLTAADRRYTLRATAELRRGSARRTVEAVAELGPSRGGLDPITVVRWDDAAF